MTRNQLVVGLAVAFLLGAAASVGGLFALGHSGTEVAAESPDIDVYYPSTEKLAPDEMRVVALGTGMPSPRPKQAAACWLVELGNGDKFLFDIGAGCHERIAAQKIPYDEIDKVFIGHLHVDHYGDLASFWLGGTTMNRLTPLRIWGPSGATPEYGTKYAMDRMQEMYVWDIATREGFIDFRGGVLEVHEFPYDAVNEVIFDENGVVIRSFPAIHGIDGAVSFTLEWNGLKLAYSSDTYPNKWWMAHTKGADISIHECFLSTSLLVTKQGFTPAEALAVGTQAHTSPEQFGKVMSLTKPRLAVGYHFQNDFDTGIEAYARVRKTYAGPLALAEDYMVFNVTADDVRVRMSAVDEAIWPPAPRKEKQAADTSKMVPLSDFVRGGAEAFPDVVGPIYEEINERFGSDIPVPSAGGN
ncbi:MAG: guanitoxin biosynthesis MBL fold metallo-hydrolase GntH [Polyangiales bacterium]